MIYTVEIILTKGRRKHFKIFYQVSDFSRFTTGITILFVENVEMNCIYYPLFPASFFSNPTPYMAWLTTVTIATVFNLYS